ncbi:TRAP transporter substrate-binding protein DctP [Solirubrobacter ginsenosidimutans]|uniref:TRAP transporter substrate-binding protein DctP n=1 Tax=Solirubrobacter ginsenosidimutans TaxID=490573 RepID=A0A9X3MP92_9ACTN|nr:TRAP transporter substrate-binding protein DctP [Solirubrobacter ginsenosidimutans]MDA0158720.1 TRAP transporter substrate-binding protein DctP [Solirubrobacter ginsenosidimutans]
MKKLLIVPLVLLAASCGGDKAGGSGGTVTLRIGTDDTPGRPSGRIITELAREARTLSGGRIRIVGAWQAAGKSHPAWDQRVARMVAAGKLDMGVIPARAWDTEGVTSLRALHAPFLVTSEPLLDRISRGSLAGELLAGLDRAGVVGLALVPEGLRHPFGFKRPLLAPGDYLGATIRVPRSDVAYSLMRTFGALPADLNDQEFKRGSLDGSVAGAESSFALALATMRVATATANVTLYPKADTIVVNREAWDALSDEQRDVLRKAAERAREQTIGSIVPEAEGARRYCEQGGRVVQTTPTGLANLRAAASVVYADLERDPRTKALIGRIRRLARETGTPVAAPAACEPPPVAALAASGDPHALDGVWRARVTYDEGIRAGLAEDVAGHELGLQTIHMDGGRYEWRWRARDGANRCSGRYRIAGDVIVFTDGGECQGSWQAAYTIDGATIRWSRVRALPPAEPGDQAVRELLHGRPWTRIDKPPSFPEGVYRTDMPISFMVAHGVDEGSANDNGGIMTMTFRGGRWLHHVGGNPSNPTDCRGSYAVAGGRVTVHADHPDCGDAYGLDIFTAAWSLRSGELRLSNIASGEGLDAFARVYWGGKPWRKIS